MQQEIRPLVAVDIIEQLHRQFAILSGKVQINVYFRFCCRDLVAKGPASWTLMNSGPKS